MYKYTALAIPIIGIVLSSCDCGDSASGDIGIGKDTISLDIAHTDVANGDVIADIGG